MYCKRNRTNTAIAQIILLIFSIHGIFNLSYSQQNKFENCSDDSIINILNKFASYDCSKNFLLDVQYSKIIWPDCDAIKKHKIDSKDIPADWLAHAERWIYQYFKPSFETWEYVRYLSKMEQGDDWIIGKGKFDRMTIYFIDGRELTIIANTTFAFKDVNNLNCLLLQQLSRIVNLEVFAPTIWLDINFEKFDKDECVIGKIICDPKYHYYNIPLTKPALSFWSNGNITIIEIEKKRIPSKSIFGYDESRSIGGIGKDDTRSFVRFSTENRIDFKKEMYRIFPWILDSLKKGAEHEQYLNSTFNDSGKVTSKSIKAMLIESELKGELARRKAICPDL
jgi:hypothetical protein